MTRLGAAMVAIAIGLTPVAGPLAMMKGASGAPGDGTPPLGDGDDDMPTAVSVQYFPVQDDDPLDLDAMDSQQINKIYSTLLVYSNMSKNSPLKAGAFAEMRKEGLLLPATKGELKAWKALTEGTTTLKNTDTAKDYLTRNEVAREKVRREEERQDHAFK